VLHFRIALDAILLRVTTDRWTVAALRSLRDRVVNLVQDGIINIGSERALNGLQVRLVAVCGQLLRRARRYP